MCRRHVLLPLIVSVVTGCAPYGRLWTPSGVERLRTAYYARLESHGLESLVLLLANSDIDCSLPHTEDPDALRDAQYQLANAFTREGARIVGIQAFNVNSRFWEGQYEVQNPVDLDALTGKHPRQAQVMYLAVNEARAEEIDGLFRSYTVEDKVEMYGVPEPGDVTIDELVDGEATGEFYLPAIDVSGTFRAGICDPQSTIIGKLYGEGFLGE